MEAVALAVRALRGRGEVALLLGERELHADHLLVLLQLAALGLVRLRRGRDRHPRLPGQPV